MYTRSVISKLLAVALSVALPASALAAGEGSEQVWKIDTTHSRVGFNIAHMVVSDVSGRFQKFGGDIRIDDSHPERSSVRIEVDVASVDTDLQKRDDHLRSPDFFDAKQHPKMTFVSKKIRKAGKRYKVKGDLTIRGTTRPVTLDVSLSKPVKNPWGTTVRAVKASGKINRKDFGLTWNQALETGGLLVGEDVELDIALELNR